VVQQVCVYVLLPPRPLLLDVAGPLEVLRQANQLQRRVRFDVHYVACTQQLQSSIGLTLANIEPLPSDLPQGAWVMLCGDVDETLVDARGLIQWESEQDTAQTERIVEWLQRSAGPSHRIISICSGALLAARAGLLDGRLCTTHHSSCAELARLAPKARVVDNRLFVEDGPCCSSAGITTGVDLMLHLVTQLLGHYCTVAIARYLVVYLRRDGNEPQLSPWLEGRNHTHPAIHKAQDAIAGAPAADWTPARLKGLCSLSPRHISRLFHQHTGMTVIDYRNRLRISLAQELLRQTRLDMEHVAERSGFASSRHMRRVWRRLYSSAPRAARDGTAILRDRTASFHTTLE
jgi:transcriptional regulator GlxA family with amidase domain